MGGSAPDGGNCGERDAEWNGNGRRAEKAGHEPRSVREDGDCNERHRVRSRARAQPAASLRCGDERGGARLGEL